MPYRRTDKVVRRLAARREAILAAARELAAEGGMAAVQIVPVSERAGIAAGTVYRYFPAKTDMLAALVAQVSELDVAAMRKAAAAAPGPLSALAAVIATFAARAVAHRRLSWAIIAEPLDAAVDEVRLSYRRALAGEIEQRLRAAIAERLVPEQEPGVVAPAIIGALMEGLVGPLAPSTAGDPGRTRELVQTLTLLSLRAAGLLDARARGLVVQTALPAMDG